MSFCFSGDGVPPGPLQPHGGGDHEPSIADFELCSGGGESISLVQLTSCHGQPSHGKANPSDIERVLEDIPIEEFCVPAFSTCVPGLRPPREESIGGASTRRFKEENPLRCRHEFTVGVTGRRPREASTDARFLPDDEIPTKMPKLPFASRMLGDSGSAAKAQGESAKSQSAESRHYRQRQNSHPLARKLQNSGLDDEEENGGCRHEADQKRDEEDSWLQQLFTDSPRNVSCDNQCRLVSCEGFSGEEAKAQPDSVPVYAADPADEAMNGLSDFVKDADDATLTYILNHEENTSEKQASTASRRLAPGTLLPGQRPGFPLSL